MDEYYRILGLPVNADAAQIKKAYRQLAMQYHPDINPSANAQEKFITITEAYEILLGIRKVKRGTLYNTSTNARPAYTYDPQKHRERFARERANRMRYTYTRERARRRAQMQYEEFVRNNDTFQHSWYFWPIQILVFMIAIIGMAFGCFLIASPFLVGYYFHLKGSNWWFGSLCFPLIAAGIQVIYQSIRLKKEAEPYFTKNSGFE